MTGSWMFLGILSTFRGGFVYMLLGCAFRILVGGSSMTGKGAYLNSLISNNVNRRCRHCDGQ